jgi:hypothetical protein
MFFSSGNNKLDKGILVWNLPRLTTCPGAGVCKDWCYEIKAEKRFPGAVACRKANLYDSKDKNFVANAVKILERRNQKYVRIHASGDFYSQRYLNKWAQIAWRLPEKTFYSYTKSHMLDFSDVPSNLIIIRSYGSKYDYLIDYSLMDTAEVVPKDHIPSHLAGEYLCPTIGCGTSCLYCMTSGHKHVLFRKH